LTFNQDTKHSGAIAYNVHTFARKLTMATATATAAKALKKETKVTKKEEKEIVPVLTEEAPEAPTKPKRQSKKKAEPASSGSGSDSENTKPKRQSKKKAEPASSGSGSDSEKKTKLPSTYNNFVAKTIAELKKDEEYMKTERKHKEIFADAAKLWAAEKENTAAAVKADPAFAKANKKDTEDEVKKRLAIKYPAPKKAVTDDAEETDEAEKPATPTPVTKKSNKPNKKSDA